MYVRMPCNSVTGKIVNFHSLIWIQHWSLNWIKNIYFGICFVVHVLNANVVLRTPFLWRTSLSHSAKNQGRPLGSVVKNVIDFPGCVSVEAFFARKGYYANGETINGFFEYGPNRLGGGKIVTEIVLFVSVYEYVYDAEIFLPFAIYFHWWSFKNLRQNIVKWFITTF